MRIYPTISLCILAAMAWGSLQGRAADEAGTTPLPSFEEVYGVVRSNLTGVSEAQLNRAAITGLLGQLSTQLLLVTNNASRTDNQAVPLLSQAAVLESNIALLRIGRVDANLPNEVAAAYARLSSTNKLKGVVVDLRFAVGTDYAAAAQTADLFFKVEQPLIQWGEATTRSTAKSAAIDLPLAVLVNGDTSGAAEALAAALRQADGAVLIGSPTAGRAYMFRDFPLTNGETLRVASGPVTIGTNQTLSSKGVAPDIRIALSPEDEKAYFEDPYRVTAKPFAQSARPRTNDLTSSQSTNRPRHRLNEAELVRMQRDGVDLEAEPLSTSPTTPAAPVITDPALSRALDLLKGIALALKRQ